MRRWQRRVRCREILADSRDGHFPDPKIGKILWPIYRAGTHITLRNVPLSSGGFIIDSPGLADSGLVDPEKEEISKYFPEMLRVTDNCYYVPCTHTHEPECAVKAALDSGTVSPERYASYLGMLEDDKKFQ